MGFVSNILLMSVGGGALPRWVSVGFVSNILLVIFC